MVLQKSGKENEEDTRRGDRSERNKPEHLHLRRPEITILSAEPLTGTSWHSASSGRFSSTAFTTQPIWSESVLTSAQLPPSYEQVIKEKTQEKVTTPLPSPRRSHTTTIATQTDSLEENVTQPDSCTSQQLNQNHSGDSAKQPKKPPRPSLPCTPKPIPRKTQTGSPTSTPSSQPIVDLALTTRPVPQPRSKTKPLSPSNQVNVQPLIPLQDSREDCPVKPVETSDAHSGKYLQELLDVFSSEPLSNSVNIQEEQTIQTKENQGDNMTSLHSDRNIRSRIQAFESQTNTEDDETSVPFPRPRKVHAKPPVLAPKPSIAPRPSVKMPKEEQLSQFEGHLYEMVNTPPMPAPRPQLFKKPSLDSKDDSDSQPPPFRASLIPPSRPSLVKLKNVSSQDEEGLLKGPPTPLKPSKDLLNLNNHNSTALVSNIASTVNMLSDDYVDATNHSPTKPARQGGFTYMGLNSQGITKRPTVIRVPSKTDKNTEETAEVPPPLPVQKPVGGPPKPSRKLEVPHGIAEYNYNGTNTGELSFQKNEVLVLLEELDSKTFECQVGNTKGTVQKTHMKIITPLANTRSNPVTQKNSSFSGVVENTGSLQVQALYDFTPEGPGELMLRAGDVVSNVEQLDGDWYMGTCRNITGFFPINYVKTLNKPVSVPAPSNEWKTKPCPEPVRGPRCVARFDFEGEQSDELSFSEGDVIQLKEYVGEEWARGEVNGHDGIFPLNFVEVVEDLPPAPVQKSVPNKIALPGMASSSNTQMSYKATEADFNGEEWAVALYDFTAETEEDLPFQQGERILVTAHIDDEWWSGRVNGREGFFPKAFVQIVTGGRKW
ncbi:SH3 domain-containing 19-like protein [Labeo rohita]|uniref:SH3 domain-containing 19-like protein n=1 Tax=Labeo rohita TaxID=84645 RepID=A0A498LVV1_LABRO|nr:SH3 domain-containing 19-like protein [Labeo rohita]